FPVTESYPSRLKMPSRLPRVLRRAARPNATRKRTFKDPYALRFAGRLGQSQFHNSRRRKKRVSASLHGGGQLLDCPSRLSLPYHLGPRQNADRAVEIHEIVGKSQGEPKGVALLDADCLLIDLNDNFVVLAY